MLSACGSSADKSPKKAEEPTLPEPKTGAEIDAAAENATNAEDAMRAAEKVADDEAKKASLESAAVKAGEKSGEATENQAN
jgi:hypothetical protein